jgi:hypothetical protein
MRQLIYWEIEHLLKMANISNPEVTNSITDNICKIAKEHYEGKDDDDDRVVVKGRWYDKIVPKWFDNESKF